MSMPEVAQHWYFNKRPTGDIEHDTLVLRTEPVPELKDGEFLFRSVYMSLDATNRVWMSDWDTYMEPLPLGARMLGFLIGEVVKSRRFAGRCVRHPRRGRTDGLCGLDRNRQSKSGRYGCGDGGGGSGRRAGGADRQNSGMQGDRRRGIA